MCIRDRAYGDKAELQRLTHRQARAALRARQRDVITRGACQRLARLPDQRVAHDLGGTTVSYTHLRAHETVLDLVCRLLLEKNKETNTHFTWTTPYTTRY